MAEANMTGLGALLSRFNPIRFAVPALVLGGVMAIAFMFLRFNMPVAMVIAIIPASLCIVWLTLRYPALAMFGLFVINYFLMGMRFLRDFPIGTVIDAMIFYNIGMLLIQGMVHKIDWRKARTGITLVAVIWAVYCILELFNPLSVPAAWVSAARNYAFYFLAIVVLTQLILGEYKYLRYLLVVWAVLTLLAFIKVMGQKYIGFTPAEKYWLYVLDARRTHIIYSGIRYFSFFSDAANFGGSMGQSMVVFSIAGLYYRSRWMKVFFFITAAAACYGMLLSGTRSAMAVPFVGFAVFVFLSRNVKMMAIGFTAIFSAFVFLNFTTIGNGNSMIRRARSTFDTQDASLQVRLENQAKLRTIMADKPFGAGLGLGGGKAKTYTPNSPLIEIATDSWFVMVWVETGLVGVTLHICSLLFVLAWGSYQVVFRIRDPQLKGITAALICGIAGIVVMSYANEVFGQIPTGPINYMCMAFIFLAPRFDQQIADGALRGPERKPLFPKLPTT